MPPKKKKGKKGKKKKKDDATLVLEDKYKKTMDEIEAIKDHLAIRKEIARRSQSMGDEWKKKMKVAQSDLDTQQHDTKVIHSELTRQYKTMQDDQDAKIKLLQVELESTNNQLRDTQSELKKTQETLKRTITEKDKHIADLEFKIGEMQKIFDGILNETLDNLRDKIDVRELEWRDEASLIAEKNKQVLLEFGLNPLQL